MKKITAYETDDGQLYKYKQDAHAHEADDYFVTQYGSPVGGISCLTYESDKGEQVIPEEPIMRWLKDNCGELKLYLADIRGPA